MNLRKETVFVGLSGGVDSSVSALRLIQEGYNVVGVFIKTWQPDFIECNWETERLDAMRVAAHLNIPFLTCGAEQSYKDDVADYMISEYTSGRTPNPDVMCNKYVKFSRFLDFALEHGADKIATGHYAQVFNKGGVYKLFRGIDASKDQSYFLWTLTQKQLQYVLFPVGNTKKTIVRKEAEKAHLPTFSKKDSQGVCFLGEINMVEFLSHYVDVKPGKVLNTAGEAIGTHSGSLYYTIGQRHDFVVTVSNTDSAPWYVVEKNLEANTITVSARRPKVSKNDIMLSDIHVITSSLPQNIQAQFRYRQSPFNISIKQTDSTHGILTVQETEIDTPSPGQSCVFYNNNECLGGGIIQNCI